MQKVQKDYSFTKFPNWILDVWLRKLTGSECLILLLIVRKTIGFHKERAKISLSYFEKFTGLARSTVKKSIDGLVDKQIIDKVPTGNSFDYGLTSSSAQNGQKNGSLNFYFPIIYPDIGSTNEPETVENLNTLKEIAKENKKDTTSSIDKSVIDLQMAWNCRFEQKVESFDTKMINHIQHALQKFSIEQIISAMDNRLKADYYKNEKPELLHNPNCFFPYENTIRTDLIREQRKLFTYEKKNYLITDKGFKDKDFSIRRDKLDVNGRPLWELIS